jgi:hypothetical protein
MAAILNEGQGNQTHFWKRVIQGVFQWLTEAKKWQSSFEQGSSELKKCRWHQRCISRFTK